jgi:hypothetical protein
MSARTTVFVSHSSKDRTLTEQVVTALEQSYVDAGGTVRDGFGVLVDYEQLRPGVEWPQRLHVMMAKCQSAVILLTAPAVASDWVLKEATILSWRRTLDRHGTFTCIPFVAPDVTRADLDARGFSPLDLQDIQWGRALEPDEVATAVRQLVPQAPTASLFDQVVGRLSDHLKGAGASTLESVATRLRVNAPLWRGPQDQQSDWVADLAAAILMGHLGDYESHGGEPRHMGLEALIDDLAQGTASDTSLRLILGWAAPSWIAPEAAGRLPIASARPDSRCLGVNGRWVSHYTAEMIVRRAHPLTMQYRVVSVAGGDAGDVVEHVTSEVCRQLRGKGHFRGSDAQIVAQLAGTTAPYIVVLGPPLPDADVLAQLRGRLPRVTFLLWSGESLEVDPALGSVDWLSPALPVDREQAEYDSYCDAQEILKQRAALAGGG